MVLLLEESKVDEESSIQPIVAINIFNDSVEHITKHIKFHNVKLINHVFNNFLPDQLRTDTLLKRLITETLLNIEQLKALVLIVNSTLITAYQEISCNTSVPEELGDGCKEKRIIKSVKQLIKDYIEKLHKSRDVFIQSYVKKNDTTAIADDYKTPCEVTVSRYLKHINDEDESKYKVLLNNIVSFFGIYYSIIYGNTLNHALFAIFNPKQYFIFNLPTADKKLMIPYFDITNKHYTASSIDSKNTSDNRLNTKLESILKIQDSGDMENALKQYIQERDLKKQVKSDSHAPLKNSITKLQELSEQVNYNKQVRDSGLSEQQSRINEFKKTLIALQSDKMTPQHINTLVDGFNINDVLDNVTFLRTVMHRLLFSNETIFASFIAKTAANSYLRDSRVFFEYLTTSEGCDFISKGSTFKNYLLSSGNGTQFAASNTMANILKTDSTCEAFIRLIRNNRNVFESPAMNTLFKDNGSTFNNVSFHWNDFLDTENTSFDDKNSLLLDTDIGKKYIQQYESFFPYVDRKNIFNFAQTAAGDLFMHSDNGLKYFTKKLDALRSNDDTNGVQDVVSGISSSITHLIKKYSTTAPTINHSHYMAKYRRLIQTYSTTSSLFIGSIDNAAVHDIRPLLDSANNPLKDLVELNKQVKAKTYSDATAVDDKANADYDSILQLLSKIIDVIFDNIGSCSVGMFIFCMEIYTKCLIYKPTHYTGGNENITETLNQLLNVYKDRILGICSSDSMKCDSTLNISNDRVNNVTELLEYVSTTHRATIDYTLDSKYGFLIKNCDDIIKLFMQYINGLIATHSSVKDASHNTVINRCITHAMTVTQAIIKPIDFEYMDYSSDAVYINILIDHISELTNWTTWAKEINHKPVNIDLLDKSIVNNLIDYIIRDILLRNASVDIDDKNYQSNKPTAVTILTKMVDKINHIFSTYDYVFIHNIYYDMGRVYIKLINRGFTLAYEGGEAASKESKDMIQNITRVKKTNDDALPFVYKYKNDIETIKSGYSALRYSYSPSTSDVPLPYMFYMINKKNKEGHYIDSHKRHIKHLCDITISDIKDTFRFFILKKIYDILTNTRKDVNVSDIVFSLDNIALNDLENEFTSKFSLFASMIDKHSIIESFLADINFDTIKKIIGESGISDTYTNTARSMFRSYSTYSYKQLIMNDDGGLSSTIEIPVMILLVHRMCTDTLNSYLTYVPKEYNHVITTANDNMTNMLRLALSHMMIPNIEDNVKKLYFDPDDSNSLFRKYYTSLDVTDDILIPIIMNSQQSFVGKQVSSSILLYHILTKMVEYYEDAKLSVLNTKTFIICRTNFNSSIAKNLMASLNYAIILNKQNIDINNLNDTPYIFTDLYVHKWFGTYDVVCTNVQQFRAKKYITNMFINSTDEVYHKIFGAYGYSGAGKSFTLLHHKTHSIFQQVIDELVLDVINNNSYHRENVHKQIDSIVVFMYDYYGEYNSDTTKSSYKDALEKFTLFSLRDAPKHKLTQKDMESGLFTVYKKNEDDPSPVNLADDTVLNSAYIIKDLQKKSVSRIMHEMNIVKERIYKYVDALGRSNLKERPDEDVDTQPDTEYHIRATPNNSQSSRSHVFIDMYFINANSYGGCKGRVTLMDMAGNEDPESISKQYYDLKNMLPHYDGLHISKESVVRTSYMIRNLYNMNHKNNIMSALIHGHYLSLKQYDVQNTSDVTNITNKLINMNDIQKILFNDPSKHAFRNAIHFLHNEMTKYRSSLSESETSSNNSTAKKLPLLVEKNWFKLLYLTLSKQDKESKANIDTTPYKDLVFLTASNNILSIMYSFQTLFALRYFVHYCGYHDPDKIQQFNDIYNSITGHDTSTRLSDMTFALVSNVKDEYNANSELSPNLVYKYNPSSAIDSYLTSGNFTLYNSITDDESALISKLKKQILDQHKHAIYECESIERMAHMSINNLAYTTVYSQFIYDDMKLPMRFTVITPNSIYNARHMPNNPSVIIPHRVTPIVGHKVSDTEDTIINTSVPLPLSNPKTAIHYTITAVTATMPNYNSMELDSDELNTVSQYITTNTSSISLPSSTSFPSIIDSRIDSTNITAGLYRVPNEDDPRHYNGAVVIRKFIGYAIPAIINNHSLYYYRTYTESETVNLESYFKEPKHLLKAVVDNSDVQQDVDQFVKDANESGRKAYHASIDFVRYAIKQANSNTRFNALGTSGPANDILDLNKELTRTALGFRRMGYNIRDYHPSITHVALQTGDMVIEANKIATTSVMTNFTLNSTYDATFGSPNSLGFVITTPYLTTFLCRFLDLQLNRTVPEITRETYVNLNTSDNNRFLNKPICIKDTYAVDLENSPFWSNTLVFYAVSYTGLLKMIDVINRIIHKVHHLPELSGRVPEGVKKNRANLNVLKGDEGSLFTISSIFGKFAYIIENPQSHIRELSNNISLQTFIKRVYIYMHCLSAICDYVDLFPKINKTTMVKYYGYIPGGYTVDNMNNDDGNKLMSFCVRMSMIEDNLPPITDHSDAVKYSYYNRTKYFTDKYASTNADYFCNSGSLASYKEVNKITVAATLNDVLLAALNKAMHPYIIRKSSVDFPVRHNYKDFQSIVNSIHPVFHTTYILSCNLNKFKDNTDALIKKKESKYLEFKQSRMAQIQEYKRTLRTKQTLVDTKKTSDNNPVNDFKLAYKNAAASAATYVYKGSDTDANKSSVTINITDDETIGSIRKAYNAVTEKHLEIINEEYIKIANEEISSILYTLAHMKDTHSLVQYKIPDTVYDILRKRMDNSTISTHFNSEIVNKIKVTINSDTVSECIHELLLDGYKIDGFVKEDTGETMPLDEITNTVKRYFRYLEAIKSNPAGADELVSGLKAFITSHQLDAFTSTPIFACIGAIFNTMKRLHTHNNKLWGHLRTENSNGYNSSFISRSPNSDGYYTKIENDYIKCSKVIRKYHESIRKQGYFIKNTFSDLRNIAKQISQNTFMDSASSAGAAPSSPINTDEYKTDLVKYTLNNDTYLKSNRNSSEFTFNPKIKKQFNLIVNVRLDFDTLSKRTDNSDIYNSINKAPKYLSNIAESNVRNAMDAYKNQYPKDIRDTVEDIYREYSLYDSVSFSYCLNPLHELISNKPKKHTYYTNKFVSYASDCANYMNTYSTAVIVGAGNIYNNDSILYNLLKNKHMVEKEIEKLIDNINIDYVYNIKSDADYYDDTSESADYNFIRYKGDMLKKIKKETVDLYNNIYLDNKFNTITNMLNNVLLPDYIDILHKSKSVSNKEELTNKDNDIFNTLNAYIIKTYNKSDTYDKKQTLNGILTYMNEIENLEKDLKTPNSKDKLSTTLDTINELEYELSEIRRIINKLALEREYSRYSNTAIGKIHNPHPLTAKQYLELLHIAKNNSKYFGTIKHFNNNMLHSPLDKISYIYKLAKSKKYAPIKQCIDSEFITTEQYTDHNNIKHLIEQINNLTPNKLKEMLILYNNKVNPTKVFYKKIKNK